MQIDIVSDVSCPWCALGVNALERALERTGVPEDLEIRFQPFQLNPDMPAQGMALDTYLTQKVGIPAAQLEAASAMLRERGETVGFSFGPREHIWNTFDAHRLIALAGAEGPKGAQRKLKLALLRTYHGEGRNPSDPDILVALAAEAGLDPARARQVLESEACADEVREAEAKWRAMGVSGVPTMVIDGRRALTGAQPVEVLERLLSEGA